MLHIQTLKKTHTIHITHDHSKENMSPLPLILSPALPSELLTYIVQYESHPTTLLICYSRAEFLSTLASDAQDHSFHHNNNFNGPPSHTTSTLLSSPLYQVAIARHIRMVFIPTVTHLRAYLSVFDPAGSKIPPPPADSVPSNSSVERRPSLLVYGFLGLHRDTSEWSAQGISATAAGLVEAARRTEFGAVVVDAPMVSAGEDEDRLAEGTGSVATGLAMLEEEAPLLSGSVARAGGDFDEAAWTGRKVSIDRVLGRWFRYKEGEWSRRSRDTTNEITS